MKMIVGLGNPGKEYDYTRHNTGFLVIDSFVSNFKFEKKFNAMIAVKIINGEKVLFVKPQTFMNNSGEAVGKIASYYHISSFDIMVVHDDMDIELGHFKIKDHGRSGGHNGIKSIIDSLGTDNFVRLKVGIGHSLDDTISYVLGRFSKPEFEKLSSNFKTYEEIVNSFFSNDSSYLMNRFNGL